MKIAGCTSPFENSLHGQITHCKCKHIIKRKKKQLLLLELFFYHSWWKIGFQNWNLACHCRNEKQFVSAKHFPGKSGISEVLESYFHQ